jgi:hypothetical protein
MIILKATTETLQISSSSSAALDYSATYADITTVSFNPDSNEGKITSATTTTIVAAPAASTQRQVKMITISNIDGVLMSSIVVQKNISSTLYNLTPSVNLLPGEVLQYMDGTGWIYYSAIGTIKSTQAVAGSTTQVQFNAAQVLTGDADLTWSTSSNTLALGSSPQITLSNVTGNPAAPTSSTLGLFNQVTIGRQQLTKMGPDGNDEYVQSALWQNAFTLWTPRPAALGTWVGALGTSGGSAAGIVPTTTNSYTVMMRSTFASIVSATNQQVGLRTTDSNYIIGSTKGIGGILFVCRFGFESIKTGMRAFVGLSGATATVSVDPSTVVNSMGFGFDLADSAISFIHNGPTATASKEPISGQGTLATNSTGYDAYIYCAPSGTRVYYRLDRTDTGATLVDSWVDYAIPLNTTYLYAHCVMSNGTANIVAGDASLGINRIYVETQR